MSDETHDISIRYRKKSFCGEPFDEEVDELVDHLAEAGLVVDERYIDHIRRYHGGVPIAKYFPGGEIERFLNFADSYAPSGAKYRDWNVNVVRNWIKNRAPENIVPFASMPHGAFVCFRHSDAAPPTVVVWNCEGTDEEYLPVADSFAGFVELLRETPATTRPEI